MFRNTLRESRRAWLSCKEIENMCNDYEAQCGEINSRILTDTELDEINKSYDSLKYFMENK